MKMKMRIGLDDGLEHCAEMLSESCPDVDMSTRRTNLTWCFAETTYSGPGRYGASARDYRLEGAEAS